MKIAAAQINPTIGDFDGNVDRILTFVSRAREMEAQLVVFPEMSLTGYPPRDLLERGWFVDRNLDALNTLASKVKDIGVIVSMMSSCPTRVFMIVRRRLNVWIDPNRSPAEKSRFTLSTSWSISLNQSSYT